MKRCELKYKNFKLKINMKKEQKQQITTEPSNVLYTLLCGVKHFFGTIWCCIKILWLWIKY